MIQQKYIRLPQNDTFIFFPEHVNHIDFEYLHPVSAGFCSFVNQEVKCFGQSVSLGLSAHRDDSFLATLQVFGMDTLSVDSGQSKFYQD